MMINKPEVILTWWWVYILTVSLVTHMTSSAVHITPNIQSTHICTCVDCFSFSLNSSRRVFSGAAVCVPTSLRSQGGSSECHRQQQVWPIKHISKDFPEVGPPKARRHISSCRLFTSWLSSWGGRGTHGWGGRIGLPPPCSAAFLPRNASSS